MSKFLVTKIRVCFVHLDQGNMKKTGIDTPWLPFNIKLYGFRLRVSTIKSRSQSLELDRKKQRGREWSRELGAVRVVGGGSEGSIRWCVSRRRARVHAPRVCRLSAACLGAGVGARREGAQGGRARERAGVHGACPSKFSLYALVVRLLLVGCHAGRMNATGSRRTTEDIRGCHTSLLISCGLFLELLCRTLCVTCSVRLFCTCI